MKLKNYVFAVLLVLVGSVGFAASEGAQSSFRVQSYKEIFDRQTQEEIWTLLNECKGEGDEKDMYDFVKKVEAGQKVAPLKIGNMQMKATKIQGYPIAEAIVPGRAPFPVTSDLMKVIFHFGQIEQMKKDAQAYKEQQSKSYYTRAAEAIGLK